MTPTQRLGAELSDLVVAVYALVTEYEEGTLLDQRVREVKASANAIILRAEAIQANRAKIPSMQGTFLVTDRFTKEVFVIEGPAGAEVFYVDAELAIRSHVIGPDGCWYPGFLVKQIDDWMLDELKVALRRKCPNAQKLQHVKTGDTFFLYAV
jgi:hypothetical protein